MLRQRKPQVLRSSIYLGAYVVMLMASSAAIAQHPTVRNGDVRRFGAKGDGKADDTAAIQRAFDAEQSLWLPAGEYRLTRALELNLAPKGYTSIQGDGAAQLIMDGAGPAMKVIGSHNGTADPKTVKKVVWTRERNPIVGGFAITGRHAEADGLWVEGAMQLTVSKLHVRKVRNAVRLHNRNRNVIVSDCHFYENSGVGLLLDEINLHQINVSNCHVSYNAQGGIVVSGGNVRNIQIAGCDIEGNMGAETVGSCNVLFDSRDGSIAEAAIIGCTIQHTRKDENSANIRVNGAGTRRRGKEVFDAKFGNIAIANNVLSDVQNNIDLDGVRGVAITGNTMWKGFRHSIRVRRSSHVVIGPNVIDRNPQYQDLAGSKDQLLIENSENVQVSGLQVSGVRGVEAAVRVANSRRVVINGLSVLDSDGVQLMLDNVVESRVSNCLLSDEREGRKAPGLFIKNSSQLLINDNMVRGGWKATTGANVILRDNLAL